MLFGIFGVREERRKRSFQVHAAALEAIPLQPLPDVPAEQEPQVMPPLEADTVVCPDKPCPQIQQDDQGRRFLKGLRLIYERIKQVQTQQQAFVEKAQSMEQAYHRELQTIRACQQQTAEILNHELERHALNPAIEATAAVAEEFSRLQEKVSALKAAGGLCPAWAEVATELDISATVVTEKLRALDIVILRPACHAPFDAACHDVCGQHFTDQGHLQGKIQSVAAYGIHYRNKLLKRARVVVYRLKSNEPLSGEQK